MAWKLIACTAGRSAGGVSASASVSERPLRTACTAAAAPSSTADRGGARTEESTEEGI
ncbi:Uncharacterised protein [Bordetella pertussis]|nr:Uncharacterised protein [Bordetella pertussis]CFW01471.1 Uncharacterised protein [Bordetella pertussis]CPN64248.1 Uncharacterised protein [Bordetella pertussis]CPP48692.1 Uncharacterised protein [Bordetella pertussis]CRE29229.1 Uncharacterised protein [Bordetella pertussis]